MPDLVGEIIAGILLGPPLADYVPNPEAWVLLGEIGLVLLVIEAGIDIDVSTLQLIGTRGFLIAIVGSILPIAFGIIIAILLNGTGDIKSALAAGATFGPTSLGIALNILRGGGVLNTPVGQLIISAAVIDDMIALIVLSQLESLTGEITAAGILIPIVSAMSFLLIGGYIALFVAPPLIHKYFLARIPPEHHGKAELGLLFALLAGLFPATLNAKASHLMGAFIAGLGFCTSHELHHAFVSQLKRLMQWLMRIFFAASIGFQVPIKDFANGTVIFQGLLFTIALLGKLLVGFMVPNFTQSRSFSGMHLRDCLITGFSMAAEGEFAFVIAVFAVENELIDPDLYASVVLAVLLSTIIPPFALRFTINYYNKRAEEDLAEIAEKEMQRNHDLEADTEQTDLTDTEREAKLAGEIRNQRAVFLCIQTQSESRWGLMTSLMQSMAKLKLDIIDHRSWHPRGINTTLVNEIYAKDLIDYTKGTSREILDTRIKEIQEALEKVMKFSETCKVKVQRWYPGVIQEIVEQVDEKRGRKKSGVTLQQRLLSEASHNLDRRQSAQTAATKEKTVDEILADMGETSKIENLRIPEGASGEHVDHRRRRRRQKMRSTPVVGGDLFGDMNSSIHGKPVQKKPEEGAAKDKMSPLAYNFGRPQGHKAEIIVDGESYDIRINNETLRALKKGFSGDMLDTRGVSYWGASIRPDDQNVSNQLQGYVRNIRPMSKIAEESDDGSDTSSLTAGQKGTKEVGEFFGKSNNEPGVPPV